LIQRAALLAIALAGASACGPSPAAPERPCAQPDLAGVVGTLCGFAQPEDVEAVEAAGVVLVTEQGWSAPAGGGAIAAVVIPPAAEPVAPPFRLWPPAEPDTERRADGGLSFGDPSCPFPAALERFSPHGLTSRRTEAGTSLVAVVRHGEREGIEFFELTGEGRAASLRWVGCVLLPDDTAGNDAAFAPNGELLVTNFLPAVTGVRAVANQVGAGLGMDTGDVLGWTSASGWRRLPNSAGAMPNGIVVSEDGAFAYVAEVGSRGLYRVHLDGSGERETVASFDGHPDNLSWTPSKTILVALLRGNPDGPPWCRAPLPGCLARWSLLEFDPRTSETTELVHYDGSAIHSVTSAARVRQWTFFGSMADDRIGILVAPAAGAAPSN
jgi:hypothetical protein